MRDTALKKNRERKPTSIWGKKSITGYNIKYIPLFTAQSRSPGLQFKNSW